jgi:uncharacterized membrane protein
LDLQLQLIQKKQKTNKQQKPILTSFHIQSKWWCGMSMVILGALLDFLSLGFAPQTVVAAFGSFTIVLNTLIAPWMLGERQTKQEIQYTMLIFVGAVLAVANAPMTQNSYRSARYCR